MIEYIFHILIIVSIYGILALAQNLIMGNTGLLSVAGAAFYGIGAYITAIFVTKLGFNIMTMLIIAPIITGFIALLVGITFARFRDDYFMLATLGFLMIFHTVVRNWETVTGGSYGIVGIAKPSIFGFSLSSPNTFIYFAIIILLLATAICYFISRSSFGRVLNSIREDEDALKIFGYKTSTYKLIVFVISASLASLGGVLFASYITFIDSNLFTINESILLWAIIILGGIAKNRGALLGALFLIAIPEALRFIGFPNEVAGLMRQCIYGLLLVIFMLYRPKGILGTYKI
ncbi:MAG: branched-chain amino acid ABC transporter permease [Candidatus Paceibacterota bacterium]|jgi:branched-chain amino acid transport system permease protein